MGKAVELAGGDARLQTVELAAEHFECPEEAVMLKDGEAIAAGERISYGELIHKHFAVQGGEVVGTDVLTAAWRRSRRTRRSASARRKYRWIARRARFA